MMKRLWLLAVPLALGVGLSTGDALAHHGWAWSTGENIKLTGTITSVKLGNPHGRVMMDVDGETWDMVVGQPWRNQQAGLKDGDIAEGVEMTVDGEPSADGAKLLKVERLWIGDKEYTLYPDRL
jgi:hypothetical protein